MSTTPKRRLTAEERRTGILDAALAVFSQRGYHESSIDEIAGEAGVSKALIYEHFASKQELYAELIEPAWHRHRGTGGERDHRGQVELDLAAVFDFDPAEFNHPAEWYRCLSTARTRTDHLIRRRWRKHQLYHRQSQPLKPQDTQHRSSNPPLNWNYQSC